MENPTHNSQQGNIVAVLPAPPETPDRAEVIQQELNSLKRDMTSQSLLAEKLESLSRDFQDKVQATQDNFHQAVQEFYQNISRQKEKEIDEIKSETSKAEETISTIKREVDALQIETMKPKRWHRDASTIVSLVAVAFSSSTALASRAISFQSTEGTIRGSR